MRKYRNTKTGAVFVTECKITGGAWEEITEAPKAAEATPEIVTEEIAEQPHDEVPAPKKPGRKKKG